MPKPKIPKAPALLDKPTPMESTLALFSVELFEGLTWECACGLGGISKVFKAAGLEVYSSDILALQHGYGEPQDFLQVPVLPTIRANIKNIVACPPPEALSDFIIHAVRLAPVKVAFLVPLQNLFQLARKKLFDDTTGYPHRVYAFVPAYNYAWAIWLPQEPKVYESVMTMEDWRMYRVRSQPQLGFG